ncbi:6-hydroxymethylpterin diphosphokinase MptE-like protein [Desulforamulus ruminis]|uniref:Motility associated factor glycosyltransferase family protein n=1 Tax=Desulforamulus ruminis (strain ATCC 23193 / DSM 2154 / NCIMB 8452 / DL) TaxID=696281 RepID=F6DNP5_DESRL|nr:6-hydroxymethylpterin diphosphokinase MptE-like protein [Desulforamulus ruminis]AEG59490.1 protein of unknown function DUF115 [Desulforamulus ruminis DSM 2154]
MRKNSSWYEKYANLSLCEPYGEVHALTPVTARNNQPSVKVGDYFLHSPYDPEKEAERLANNHFKSGHFHILIGFGLGYLARKLFNKFTDKKDYLLIIEPNLEVFQYALTTIDFEPLIKSNQVGFVVGEKLPELNKYLELYINNYFKEIVIIELPNYSQLYPDLVLKIKNILTETTRDSLLNINTVHFFASDWQQNFMENLFRAIKSKPFLDLLNKLSCPIIIVSAGPSLTKQISLLHTVQNKAFILCAGSAITPLLAAGVRPHAVVSIDGGETNYHIFRELDLNTIPLIYDLVVHRRIVAEHNGPQVVFSSIPTESGLAKWTRHFLRKEIGYLLGGASVANFCIDIACKITSGAICFIGQDFAYTENKSHADNHKNIKNLSGTEIRNNERYFEVKGYFGDTVLTDTPLQAMKRAFEEYILVRRQTGDQRSIINATEGGALIEGAQNMAFKEFIDTYCTLDYSQEISNLFLNEEESENIDWCHYDKIINGERKKLLKIIELCQKANKKIGGIKPGQETIDADVLIYLDKIDKKLQSLLKKDLMHYILGPVAFRAERRFPEQARESRSERCQRILTKSKALYQDIYEASLFTEKCMEELLDKFQALKEINSMK